MSVLNSELEEAAVGTMMPVVTPDQVLEKNTAESVDKEFSALKMFSREDEINSDDDINQPSSTENTIPNSNNFSHTIQLESVEEDILHKNGLDSVIYEDSKIEERADYFTDEEFFGEAANIDDDIKDIIKKLNDKGYETLYSCSGHPSARLKSDGKRDGIKDKKLYSTAKIVFAKDYNFPSYPDGWEEKKLDEGNIGIYVKGPTFRIINGLPIDQFYNWKKKYMRNLENWVDELPNKDDLGKDEKSDEITESMNELFQDLMIDLA